MRDDRRSVVCIDEANMFYNILEQQFFFKVVALVVSVAKDRGIKTLCAVLVFYLHPRLSPSGRMIFRDE